MPRDNRSQKPAQDPPWKEAHARALQEGAEGYSDPVTGFWVWTEIAHRKKGRVLPQWLSSLPLAGTGIEVKTKKEPGSNASRLFSTQL